VNEREDGKFVVQSVTTEDANFHLTVNHDPTQLDSAIHRIQVLFTKLPVSTPDISLSVVPSVTLSAPTMNPKTAVRPLGGVSS
jgi:hypothetical protein